MGSRAVRAKRDALSLPPSAREKDRRAMRRKRTGRPADAGLRFATDVARLVAEDKCEDVTVIDLRGVSTVCDFFVLATGTSDRQLRAVTDHVEQLGRAGGETPYGRSGYEDASWIVLDYVDVVVHLFLPEQRLYYDLDSLWGDCPRVTWNA